MVLVLAFVCSSFENCDIVKFKSSFFFFFFFFFLQFRMILLKHVTFWTLFDDLFIYLFIYFFFFGYFPICMYIL